MFFFNIERESIDVYVLLNLNNNVSHMSEDRKFDWKCVHLRAKRWRCWRYKIKVKCCDPIWALGFVKQLFSSTFKHYIQVNGIMHVSLDLSHTHAIQSHIDARFCFSNTFNICIFDVKSPVEWKEGYTIHIMNIIHWCFEFWMHARGLSFWARFNVYNSLDVWIKLNCF